jgi:hypothetical protein
MTPESVPDTAAAEWTPGVVTLPAEPEYRLYPGGYLGCLSAIRVDSFMHGRYTVRCHEPRGHDGKHVHYLHNGRQEWTDAD